MKYMIRTVHLDPYEVEADNIELIGNCVVFISRNAEKEDQVVGMVRFDHFKSATKLETLH
jgi:hypothetical protein